MRAVDRMLLSLRGLSVGDAFGERFFDMSYEGMLAAFRDRQMPPAPWPYTDDTQMAFSIVEVLRESGKLDPDALARGFAGRFDPERDYGEGAIRLLQRLRDGASWRKEAPAMFEGQGSYGNGAAMRVAPLGAFFAEDLDAVRENALLSAMPTHAHAEGGAGAVAVALAAALAWRVGEGESLSPAACFEQVLSLTPSGEVRGGLLFAAELGLAVDPREVAAGLGSGHHVSAQDTVPFALWCAFRHLDDYQEALWATASGQGDIDTNCAIVGGIVALSDRLKGIPEPWLAAREALPAEFDLPH